MKVYLRSTFSANDGKIVTHGDVPPFETLTVTLMADDGTTFIGSCDTPSNEYARKVYRVIYREAAKIATITYNYYKNDSGAERTKTIDVVMAEHKPLSVTIEIW